MGVTRELTASEREWLRVRDYLREHRYDLAVTAAEDFPASMHVAGTPLLALPHWTPQRPLPLDAIDLEFRPDAPFDGVTGDEAASWLPERPDGRRYERYSEAMGELAAPAVFENRPTYRLLEADLSGERGRLVFGRGSYFDGIDTGEAAAHEYAAAHLGTRHDGVRAAIGDPCDVTRRPVNLAISTLTIRRDRETGESTFYLHWRDPAKVGHAGGLYQVIPVGVFQPSGNAPWNERNDFSLWRNMLREFAEELGGQSEDHGSEQEPIDYDVWPFARHFTEALTNGKVQAHCLGVGVDPLTYATDLLTAVAIDAPLFDKLFGVAARANNEGLVLAAQPFNQSAANRFGPHSPMQAAAAALVLRMLDYVAILAR